MVLLKTFGFHRTAPGCLTGVSVITGSKVKVRLCNVLSFVIGAPLWQCKTKGVRSACLVPSSAQSGRRSQLIVLVGMSGPHIHGCVALAISTLILVRTCLHISEQWWFHLEAS